MKNYKLKAKAKVLVIFRAVAYKSGTDFEITIDEETLEKLKPFIEIISLEDTESKKQKKTNNENAKSETLDNFIENNF